MSNECSIELITTLFTKIQSQNDQNQIRGGQGFTFQELTKAGHREEDDGDGTTKMLGISDGISHGKMGIFRRKIQTPTEITTDKPPVGNQLVSDYVPTAPDGQFPTELSVGNSVGHLSGSAEFWRKIFLKILNFEKKFRRNFASEIPLEFFS